MRECVICKNTQGFINGTCEKCGYNYKEHRFKRIEVRIDDLQALGVDAERIDELIQQHYRRYKRVF